MNDFLHDVSPYVVNRPHHHYRAPSIVAPLSGPSSTIYPIHTFVEFENFDFDLETICEKSPDTPTDPSNGGTSFSEDKPRFNQFGTIKSEIS
jgi:hypothetical protein